MNGPPSDLLTTAELARREDFRLGAAQVSPSTRMIRGPGGEGGLEPRAMQVLVTLAEAAGRVVTREALFRRCWGAALVGEDSLNRAIADIRRLGRAVAPGSFEIETVPRTGYRLVAGAADAEPRPRLRRRLLVGGGLAAGGAGVLWLGVRGADRARAQALIADSDAEARKGLPEADLAAARLLEHATSLDPRSPDAWGKLALARARLAEASPPDGTAALVGGAQAAARRALGLDPRQADALAALAILPPYFGDWAAAEARMGRVLAVAPDHLPTRDARAFLYASVGRVRENHAERLAISAREPLDATLLYRLIYAHWMVGRLEEADRVADRALQLFPKHPGAWFARLWTLAFTGRADRALAHLRDAAGRPDLPPWMVDSLAIAMSALHGGRPAERARTVRLLLDQVSQGPSLSVNALLILNGLGEVDRAFEVARAYLLEEGPLMASVRWRPGQVSINDQRRRKTHMLFVPVSAPMRADPRFAGLVERVGLSAYWRAAGVTPDHLKR